MPASKPWLTPARVRVLRIGGFAILGFVALALALLFIHRGLLPIVAWLLPSLETFFYDLAVFGAYRTKSYVSFDLVAPRGVNVLWHESCDDGHVYIAPNGDSVAVPGPILLDSRGELLWTADEFDFVTNFQMQEYRGENYLTFWGGHKHGSLGEGATFMLDSNYNVAYHVQAIGEGLKADLHEFAITKDGTALITIYNTTTVDLRPMGWGRGKEGWIKDCIFQEIDIETNELLFQWRSQDHYKPEDSYYWHPFGGYIESIPFDYFHINSIEKDSKGNFLISSRHFHTVTYIDGKTGETIWTMGGGKKTNDFTDLSDGLATSFQWQHHARWVSEEEGIMTILDNGIAGPLHVDAPYSKGLMLQVDHENKTATHLRSYVSQQHDKAASQGSVSILPNDHVLIGWGSSAAWTEFEMDGTVLCESHFAASWSFWWERVKNYRVFKMHGWVGKPHWPPMARLLSGSLYVSWNGATEVKYWELQGSHSKDKHDEDSYETIDSLEKEHFETEFILPAEGGYKHWRVVALDGDREVLGVSDPAKPADGARSTVWGVILGICAVLGCLIGVWYCLRVWARGRRRSGGRRRFFGWDNQYSYSKL